MKYYLKQHLNLYLNDSYAAMKESSFLICIRIIHIYYYILKNTPKKFTSKA